MIAQSNKRVTWVEPWPCKNHPDLDMVITMSTDLAIAETKSSFQRAMDDKTRPDGGYKGKMPTNSELLEQFQATHWAVEV